MATFIITKCTQYRINAMLFRVAAMSSQNIWKCSTKDFDNSLQSIQNTSLLSFSFPFSKEICKFLNIASAKHGSAMLLHFGFSGQNIMILSAYEHSNGFSKTSKTLVLNKRWFYIWLSLHPSNLPSRIYFPQKLLTYAFGDPSVIIYSFQDAFQYITINLSRL